MSQENLVLKCLAEAQKKLDDAIDRQRALQQGDQPRNAAGEYTATASESPHAPSLNAETTTAKKESVESNEDDDPDNMAAAFFAMQAKKQQDEDKEYDQLFDDWAKLFIRKEQRAASTKASAQTHDESSLLGKRSHPNAETTTTTQSSNERSAAQAQELLDEFKRIIRS